MSHPQTARVGRCAIFGRPNVGKSTLLNALVGQKLAITSATRNTTRTCLVGFTHRRDMHIAWVDTPGFTAPTDALGRLIHAETRSALDGVDAALLLLEAPLPLHGIAREEQAITALLKQRGVPTVCALTKVDKLKDKTRLIPQLAALDQLGAYTEVVPLSALKKVNLDSLIGCVSKLLPQGSPVDEDVLTDRPMRFFAAEFVREALLCHTRNEVPHRLAVTIERFEESDKLTEVDALITVEREAHKGIVVGKAGTRLKEVGMQARLSLEELFGHKVMLRLWVRVAPGWVNHASQAKELLSELGEPLPSLS